MGKIRVNTDILDSQEMQIGNIIRNLEQIAEDVNGISNRLDWNITSSRLIKEELKRYKNYIRQLEHDTRNLALSLNVVNRKYTLVEERNKNKVIGAKKKLVDFLLDVSIVPGIFAPLVGPGGTCPERGFKIPIEMLGYPLGIHGISSVMSGNLLGGKVERTKKATWDTSKGDATIEVGTKASGYLAQGTLKQSVGIFSSTEKVEVVTGAVEGKMEATLWKDGKLSPSVGAKISGEVAAAKGDIKAQAGTDQYNAHVGADGSVLKAKAEGSVAAGKITYKDENDVSHTGLGVEAKAGAEAYVAEGKVSGGFTIAGVKIDASLSGKAGGAGAKVGGRVTTGGVSGEVGLGLGLGAGLKISVDWSGFDWSGLYNRFGLC